jgi:hypothetical protein
VDDDSADHVYRPRMPKMDVPRFDGEHPKLWQLQCEDYFEMYNTAPHMWVRLASMQFSGAAAKWLSSVQSLIRKFIWAEFCHEVVQRFGRNQHQFLIRKLYKLKQTGTVEEYIHQFAESWLINYQLMNLNLIHCIMLPVSLMACSRQFVFSLLSSCRRLC